MNALADFTTLNEKSKLAIFQQHFPNEKSIVTEEHRYMTLTKRNGVIALILVMSPEKINK